MQAMLDDGISTRRGVMCAHLEPAYLREPWRAQSSDALAVSERISGDGLILPLYIEMTDDDESRVVTSLERAIERES
jgi:dTDP-4-amino-4,6-dideoxygalactose transaminase